MPRLPEDIVRQRVVNELRACLDSSRHTIRLEEGALEKFPNRVWIELVGCPAMVRRGDRVETSSEHRFLLEVPRDYPYERPTVIWATDIFHPNIMLPSEGGFVCTGLLEGWTSRSTLLGFLQGLEALLANPNADSPYGTASCTSAAQYLNAQRATPGRTPQLSRTSG